MPSPIAHISVGYVIYRCLRSKWQVASGKWQAKTSGDPEVKPSPPWRGAVRRGGFLLFLTCILLSLLPDMDCIPGLLVGDLKPFHNYYSHSIFVLLLAAVPLTCLIKFLLRGNHASLFTFRNAYAFTSFCLLLHITMDLLGYGRGQMLFWPITDARFKLPFYIFYGLRWSEGWMSVHHLWSILTEGMFAVVIIAATHRYLRHR